MLYLRRARPMLTALAICAATFCVQGTALADDAQENKALKEQMRQMMQRMDALQKQVEGLSRQQAATPPPAVVTAPAPVPVPPPVVAKTPKETPAEPKFDKFLKGFYGTLDASVDGSTKGMDGMVAYHYGDAVNGVYPQTGVKGTPFGPVGWQPSIATNTATLGWRGSHDIPEFGDTKFIIQIEANVALTDSPGVQTGYTAQTNGVRGGIGSGTTYLGFSSPSWGALKLGHGSTPYNTGSRRLDPFAGMVGDMTTIMGNSGGDNRVEFNAAMDHAIWYESPKFGPVSFDLFFSPGQNRTPDSLNLAGGSSNCSGGNLPGSGNLPLACDDGGFDNAYSVDLKYQTEHLYLTAAYELHKRVNRNSDGIGSNAPGYAAIFNQGDPNAGGGGPLTPYLNWDQYNFIGSAYGATGSCTTAPSSATYYCVNATPEFNGDIGDEAAYRFGAQYVFDFGLTVSGIFERMTRKLPAALEFQNERQRNGEWLAFTQALTPKDNLNLGWAHAGRTPGDPGGQHNYNPNNSNNTANMISLAYKHILDKQMYWYVDLAETINSGNAHYDLGAGSHGIKTDCHDGTTSPIIDYTSAGNTTWGGCRPKAISIGVDYKF